MLHCIAVKGKSRTQAASFELIATRVKPETKAGFELVAQAENRSVSAELRRMIEQRVKEFEAELAEAA